MSWNYRIVHRTGKYPESLKKDDPSLNDWEYYGIHEVYYDEHGNPEACTKSNVSIGSEDPDELGDILEMMKLALDNPILEMVDFEKMSETQELIKTEKKKELSRMTSIDGGKTWIPSGTLRRDWLEAQSVEMLVSIIIKKAQLINKNKLVDILENVNIDR